MRLEGSRNALNALRHTQENQNNLNRYLKRISTGLRLNSAADDPANLAISQKHTMINNGLLQANRNIQDGLSMLQTIDGAYQQMMGVFQRMRVLAIQAANDTYTDADRAMIQQEIDQLVEHIDLIASSTSFNNRQLLIGNRDLNQDDGTRVIEDFAVVGIAKIGIYRVTMTQAAESQILASDLQISRHNDEWAASALMGLTDTSSPVIGAGNNYFNYNGASWELSMPDLIGQPNPEEIEIISTLTYNPGGGPVGLTEGVNYTFDEATGLITLIGAPGARAVVDQLTSAGGNTVNVPQIISGGVGVGSTITNPDATFTGASIGDGIGAATDSLETVNNETNSGVVDADTVSVAYQGIANAPSEPLASLAVTLARNLGAAVTGEVIALGGGSDSLNANGAANFYVSNAAGDGTGALGDTSVVFSDTSAPDWTNAVAGEGIGGGLNNFSLAQTWIANAANNGPGSSGDTSLVFSDTDRWNNAVVGEAVGAAASTETAVNFNLAQNEIANAALNGLGAMGDTSVAFSNTAAADWTNAGVQVATDGSSRSFALGSGFISNAGQNDMGSFGDNSVVLGGAVAGWAEVAYADGTSEFAGIDIGANQYSVDFSTGTVWFSEQAANAGGTVDFNYGTAGFNNAVAGAGAVASLGDYFINHVTGQVTHITTNGGTVDYDYRTDGAFVTEVAWGAEAAAGEYSVNYTTGAVSTITATIASTVDYAYGTAGFDTEVAVGAVNDLGEYSVNYATGQVIFNTGGVRTVNVAGPVTVDYRHREDYTVASTDPANGEFDIAGYTTGLTAGDNLLTSYTFRDGEYETIQLTAPGRTPATNITLLQVDDGGVIAPADYAFDAVTGVITATGISGFSAAVTADYEYSADYTVAGLNRNTGDITVNNFAGTAPRLGDDVAAGDVINLNYNTFWDLTTSVNTMAEDPILAVNGTYSDYPVSDATSLRLSVGGAFLTEGVNYTVEGASVRLLGGIDPTTVTVQYATDPASAAGAALNPGDLMGEVSPNAGLYSANSGALNDFTSNDNVQFAIDGNTITTTAQPTHTAQDAVDALNASSDTIEQTGFHPQGAALPSGPGNDAGYTASLAGGDILLQSNYEGTRFNISVNDEIVGPGNDLEFNEANPGGQAAINPIINVEPPVGDIVTGLTSTSNFFDETQSGIAGVRLQLDPDAVPGDVSLLFISGYRIHYGANKDQYEEIILFDSRSSTFSLAQVQVDTRDQASASIQVIDDAINRLSEFMGFYAAKANGLANRATFNSIYHENLTNANGLIQDANLAEEIAGMLKTSIMNRTGMSMLQQAMVLDRTVIRMLL